VTDLWIIGAKCGILTSVWMRCDLEGVDLTKLPRPPLLKYSLEKPTFAMQLGPVFENEGEEKQR
jgi:hypothetical protein